MKLIYSFNKAGYEAEFWMRELAAASTDDLTIIPFNHAEYLDPNLHIRAQLLDNLYYERHRGLTRLYADILSLIRSRGVDVLMVDACPPYHPEFLREVPAYKVLRTGDGPMSAYDRDFAYVHAYDHILFHSNAYSRDMDMGDKLRYCGAKRADWWPLCLFDAGHDVTKSETEIFSAERDIDVVFVGAMHPNKMPALAKIKKAFGRKCVMHGLTSLKKNVYFNLRYGLPGWITPIGGRDFVPLYQRAKIGFNVHNRGLYTTGNFRLFELPGNGVMQISDGGRFLGDFFDVGKEVVPCDDADELVDKIRYYLDHDEERRAIALAGYRRVMKDHRLALRMQEAKALIERGMEGRPRSTAT